VALASGLVQPFNVCVTVYVLFAVTFIDSAVAPVLHKNVAPGAPVAVNSELPQLFATFTTGAGTFKKGSGDAVALPGALVHPLTV